MLPTSASASTTSGSVVAVSEPPAERAGVKGRGCLTSDSPVSFRYDGRSAVVRTVAHRSGRESTTTEVLLGEPTGDAHADFDLAWLNAGRWDRSEIGDSATVRIADLFCGAGGLTLGVCEAIRALGARASVGLAADLEPSVERAYRANFDPCVFVSDPLESRLDGDPSLAEMLNGQSPLTEAEIRFRKEVGEIDLVVGGPPCQGHSNLNNLTRRDDPKNLLYGRMARFARVFRPKHLIIENVLGVAHDRGRVMQRTRSALARLGYQTDVAIVRAEHIGVAQTRHRRFMVASRMVRPDLSEWEEVHRVAEPRSVDWALSGLPEGTGLLDARTRLAERTRARIRWLFENDAFELPDRLRPDCHRLKSHTYTAVYGRIRGDGPAPTITTGFTVMGQGRFIHPHRERPLTPREGARLQFFPSWFSFGESAAMTKKELVRLIGNAVPPKMAFVLATELLR